jgi:hypothetical protein
MRRVITFIVAAGLAFGLTASVAESAPASVACRPIPGSC